MLPVMIRCPNTNDVAWTGLATARPSLNHLDARLSFSFDCPVCQGQHQWSKADAWLDDDSDEIDGEGPGRDARS